MGQQLTGLKKIAATATSVGDEEQIGGETWESLALKTRYSASGLAQACGISLRTLQRHFQSRYRLRVSDWLREIRLEEAHLRILSGNHIKEVAYDLGFKQLSHFSRAFKERFGVPPSVLTRPRQDQLPRVLPARSSLNSRA